MPSLAGKMAKVDAYIFDTIGETAIIGSNEVKGIFFKQYREILLPDQVVVGLDISFDCRYENVNTLQPGDQVVIETETYRFQRHIPVGGDETGKCTMELGHFLP